MDGDVLRTTHYDVFVSQLIRSARVSNHVDGFNTRTCCKVFKAKLLKQGYKDIKNFLRVGRKSLRN